MKINTSYPYPVLYVDNEDYIDSSFDSNIQIQESFGELHVSIKFTLKNDTIEQMIMSNRCTFLVHIGCSQTSYRKAYKTSENLLDITIPSEQLRGKMDIYTFIVANERITKYTNDLLNDWFRNMPITFEKGNILAIGNAIETTMVEDNMELMNLPSIAKVTKSLKNEYMEVDINSNIITISIPAYEYDQYAQNANSMLKGTILSSVMVPSLVYMFSRIKESPEDLEEYTWYQVLEKIFQENNIRLDDVGTDSLSALKAAQMVLSPSFGLKP